MSLAIELRRGLVLGAALTLLSLPAFAQAPSQQAPQHQPSASSGSDASPTPSTGAQDQPGADRSVAVPASREAAGADTPVGTVPEHDATNWVNYGGSNAADHFSPADQITPQNVGKLEKVWEFHTGDKEPPADQAIEYAFENAPLKVGSNLYVCTPSQIVIDVDPATGKEKWRFDPKVKKEALQNIYHAACRGVAYWQAPEGTQECRTRIIYGVSDGRMLAIDAEDGTPCTSFGENGTVDMLAGIGEKVPGFFSPNSAPTIVDDVVVMGHQVVDNQALDAPSGVVRGWDALTGKMLWAWDLDRPGQYGPPPEGKSFTRGTPNVWTMIAADKELGLIYLPMGNRADDYWGGGRTEQEEKYTASLTALDVKTGEPRWTFQTVHHDIWDYDLGSQPTLVDWPGKDGPVPAVIQASKQGEIFVLDRRNGRPLMPVEEKRVPQGTSEGDHTAPTQPFSTAMPAFSQDRLTGASMWGVSPIDQLWCRIQFQKARYEGTFTPPVEGKSGSWIEFPGDNGGMDWGGISYDPINKVLVVNTNRMPDLKVKVPREEVKAKPIGQRPEGEKGSLGGPQVGAPFGINSGKFLSPIGVPCIAPPWGYLSGIEIPSGKLLWKKPLGTPADQGPFGISSHIRIPIGTPNNGGSVVTAGGVTFIAAALDDYIRAFDTRTGEQLWEARLPAGGQANPISFTEGGRQYIVLAAGGHHFMRTKLGDSVVAYALPENTAAATTNGK
ncbi:MAG: pyrroloquinoline quinone-dependent dehydrogenase [Rhodobiaceae bacterium]|nr:pyrroloquinoline quinone-dependent dehydrogenase [Rhodobiaceae bacterium]MCC0057414.1 pyrroloquinoline quinone-dependent dehydrogenase [Rhodobiaceae bacterium]